MEGIKDLLPKTSHHNEKKTSKSSSGGTASSKTSHREENKKPSKHRSSACMDLILSKRHRLNEDMEKCKSSSSLAKSKFSVPKSDKKYDSSSGKHKCHSLQDQSKSGEEITKINFFPSKKLICDMVLIYYF